MKKYRDRSSTGIIAYEIGEDYIIAEFKSGKNRFYKFTVSSSSHDNVAKMKEFAETGGGLNEFIRENKINYDSRW